jgi:hypothetical protein
MGRERFMPIFPELRPYLMTVLEETGFSAAAGSR